MSRYSTLSRKRLSCFQTHSQTISWHFVFALHRIPLAKPLRLHSPQVWHALSWQDRPSCSSQILSCQILSQNRDRPYDFILHFLKCNLSTWLDSLLAPHHQHGLPHHLYTLCHCQHRLPHHLHILQVHQHRLSHHSYRLPHCQLTMCPHWKTQTSLRKAVTPHQQSQFPHQHTLSPCQ